MVVRDGGNDDGNEGMVMRGGGESGGYEGEGGDGVEMR